MTGPPGFPIYVSDGNSAHTPTAAQIQSGYQDASNLQLEPHSIFTKEMMKVLGGEFKKDISYNKFPDGYRVWVRQRAEREGQSDSPKYDFYIFGHPKLVKFDSFRQFAKHIGHIQQLQLRTAHCPCKVCKKNPLDVNDIVRRMWEPARLDIPEDAHMSSSEEEESEEGEGGGGEAEGAEEEEGEEDEEGEEGEEDEKGEEDELGACGASSDEMAL